MRIRFLSKNPHKIAEVQAILTSAGVEVVPLKIEINEIQTQAIDDMVRDKCLKAFKAIGRPVLVEHTGIFISKLNGLPGGLTQLFWDGLEADRFTQLFGIGPDTSIEAKTVLGYCDSRRIFTFEGSVRGTVPPEPRGSRDFQWDCVFIPEGYDETFAEMGDKKNEISMRRLALEKLLRFFKED